MKSFEHFGQILNITRMISYDIATFRAQRMCCDDTQQPPQQIEPNVIKLL